MTWRVVYMMVLGGCLLVNTGCGFGGFDSGGASTRKPDGADNEVTIGGVVAKGPFSSGAVRVLGVKLDGTRVLFKEASIDVFGNYSVRIDKPGPSDGYTGTVLLEASGRYRDEATGLEYSVTGEVPLRAALPAIAGKAITAVVTPLTELAVRTAGGNLSPESVNAANTYLSNIFKVDVVGTRPVQPTSTVFLMTSQEPRDYSLALAAFSQMAKDTGMSLSDLLAYLSIDLAGGISLSEGKAAQFRTALVTFLLSEMNQTGMSDISMTNLVNAGGPVRTVKIVTEGVLPVQTGVDTITVTIKLPANVRLRAYLADSRNVEPYEWVMTASGWAAGENTVQTVKYSPASGEITMSLANARGFRFGEFATLRCDVPAGMVIQAADFALSNVGVFDPDGVKLSAVGMRVMLE